MTLATSSGAPSRCIGIVLHDLLGARRQDGGVDLARRDGVDADAERPKSAAISRVSAASAALLVA